jgi:ABC-type multidrug transport system ATPase subunit
VVVVDADDVGVRSYRAWIYRGFSLRAERGELIAIAGPGGSGRTSVLLTLGGRMRFADGSLRVLGLPLPQRAGTVRSRVAVARIGGAADLADELRVRDHVREQSAAGGGTVSFADACSVVGASFAGSDLVGSLPRHEVTLLALCLAVMAGRDLVLLDDLDLGATGSSQLSLWQAARRAAAHGACVVASALEGSAVASQVVTL